MSLLMSNLAQRILTAAVGIPVVIGVAWLGGWFLFALLVLVALAAQWEVYGLLRASGFRPFVWAGLGLGVLALARFQVDGLGPFLLLGGILLLCIVPFMSRKQPLVDLSGTVLGVFYPTALLAFALPMRSIDLPAYGSHVGFWLLLVVLASIWGADTLAYFVGRALGKHPMAPNISPKKTWEGAIGGVAGAAIVLGIAKLVQLPFLSWVDVIILVLCCGVAGQLGDLAESSFKRAAGVKDSATWLPGHGGMLDRMDAATIAIPLATLYVLLVVLPG